MAKTMLMTFTYVVEYRGGTYCAQVKAQNVEESVIAWAEKLKVEKQEIKYLGDKTIDEIIRLAKDKDFKPVPLSRLKNIWYAHYTTKNGSFSINIIQTDIKS